MTDMRQLHTHNTPEEGDHVVYLMSRDQRVRDNHALIAAQEKALELSLPLVVVFDLHDRLGYRSKEHVMFMLSGLERVKEGLAALNIGFALTNSKPGCSLEHALLQLRPAALYFDFSPLKNPRTRAKKLAKTLAVSSYVVDTHNIIPVWHASPKQEFAAHTFRPKVHRLLSQYLVEPPELVRHPHSSRLSTSSLGANPAEIRSVVDRYSACGIEIPFTSSKMAASEALESFIGTRLMNYAGSRNNIAIDGQSKLSPYLHFGQISSLRVALSVMEVVDEPPLLYSRAKMPDNSELSLASGMNVLFEEMIVRKELSDNFCFYAPSYSTLGGTAEWALTTLQQHASDPREYIYSYDELRDAHTHDAAWNAAQTELLRRGKIHGYMRMYWAKKILEWTESPECAVDYAIQLNDTYSIDGGDPNGYVGILWAIAGLHDRPWTERPVFGKIRYMNFAGLTRKFDIESYISRVAS